MATRATEDDVRDIYSTYADGTALGEDGVAFWLDAANDFITDRLGGESVSSNTMERLEALVACHMIHASDPLEAEYTEGDGGAVFEGADQGGPGLRETRFGRMAIMLDPTAVLSAEGVPRPTFDTYGATSDEVTD